MGIDPAPFWANLFLYWYENKFISSLCSKNDIRRYKFHSTSRFIDDLIAINDNGEFGKCFKEIYPPELELKLEHQGLHATFLDLDIRISEGKFQYKLFDKRDNFNFFIVRMPNLTSNIPTSVFYGSILSEFLRIARSTLLFKDFCPKANELYRRMITQGGQDRLVLKQINIAFTRHKNAFEKFQKSASEIVDAVIAG